DVSALEQVPVEETVTEDFTIEADVVVIGSGAAGMSAAIEAAEAGSSVVVLEKLARTGGSSRLSSAMLVAGGTELQEAAGIEDTVEALKEYWVERGEGNIDEEMTDYVAENVNDALDWLMDMGVDYENGLILYSGTADVARAHMPLEGGRNMMDAMVAKAESLGVEIYLETPAVSLIQDEDGAVVGVMAEQNGATVTANAKAVVVATGGYGWNSDLIAEYSPNAEGAWSVSSTGSTGDGLLMAMDIGADTVFKGGFIGWKVASPSYGHTTSEGAPIYGTPNLIVNENGERFCDESEDYPFMYNDMLADGSDLFYFIFAGESDETTDLENNVSDTVANLELAVEAGICYKADTIEELAEVAGLDGLVDAVENFNSAIDAGTDEEFGRDTSGMTKYENGPFYAIQSMRATLGTFGGLNTNITGEVVDTEGNDIPGLYAAGEVANGEFFPEIYPASGSSLSMCVVLGREAGKSAAAYVQQ
ncbi:MAG: FAD-dependent oxidoreductase, partial [Clostridiales bacterium]|nr:FAD-dependent oxidoreductase [Clostridiales bacterium]